MSRFFPFLVAVYSWFSGINLCQAFQQASAFAPVQRNSRLQRSNAAPFKPPHPLTKVPFRTAPLNFFQQKNESEEEKLESFQKDIQEKFTQDRTYDDFGLLTPIAESLDGISGDWALSYADLSPSTPRTIEGQVFLATNVGYAIAGIILGTQGDWFFAGLTELAGIVSFWYHYIQLEYGKDRSEVRLALLTDYFTAGAALLTGGYYMADMGISAVPFEALISGAVAIICLSLCWVWEFGIPYIFWHSLWHLGSAYTGYLIGQAHVGR